MSTNRLSDSFFRIASSPGNVLIAAVRCLQWLLPTAAQRLEASSSKPTPFCRANALNRGANARSALCVIYGARFWKVASPP